MARKPTTRNIYDMIGTNADLPIFSGEAPTVQAGTFKPQPVAAQESMFDLRPELGKTEPTYTPKEA